MAPNQSVPLISYTTALAIILAIIFLAFLVFIIYFMVRMLESMKARRANQHIYASLSEALKEQRNANKMTQEYVAEAIGVSRQAVSKWESGKSEPSTSNLIALSRLYGVTVEDLLKDIK